MEYLSINSLYIQENPNLDLIVDYNNQICIYN